MSESKGWRRAKVARWIVVIPSRRKGCFLSSPFCTPIQRDPTVCVRHLGIPRFLSYSGVRFSLAPVLHVPLDCSGFIITRWSPTTRSSGIYVRGHGNDPLPRMPSEIKTGVNRFSTRCYAIQELPLACPAFIRSLHIKHWIFYSCWDSAVLQARARCLSNTWGLFREPGVELSLHFSRFCAM